MTLEDLLKLYNFYWYDVSQKGERVHNSKVVRVYFDGPNEQFFEIGHGALTLTYCEDPGSSLRRFLNKEVLRHRVDSFTVNDDLGILEIMLAGEDE